MGQFKQGKSRLERKTHPATQKSYYSSMTPKHADVRRPPVASSAASAAASAAAALPRQPNLSRVPFYRSRLSAGRSLSGDSGSLSAAAPPACRVTSNPPSSVPPFLSRSAQLLSVAFRVSKDRVMISEEMTTSILKSTFVTDRRP